MDRLTPGSLLLASNSEAFSKAPEVRQLDIASGIPGVLLIEDDPLVVDLLEDALRAAGYRVLIARTAREGLELFRQSKEETGVVVLDYTIPGMHPARLIEGLYQHNPRVKILISLGYSASFITADFPLEKVAGFIPY